MIVAVFVLSIYEVAYLNNRIRLRIDSSVLLLPELCTEPKPIDYCSTLERVDPDGEVNPKY